MNWKTRKQINWRAGMGQCTSSARAASNVGKVTTSHFSRPSWNGSIIKSNGT